MEQTEAPLTLTRFIEFFSKNIEPRFSGIDGSIHQVFEKTNQIDQQFDDLYKKFEDLRQEYIFANEQIRRLTTSPSK